MNTFVELLGKKVGLKKDVGILDKYLEDFERVVFYNEKKKNIHQHLLFYNYKYEKKWKKIKVKKVQVFGLFGMCAIGECVPRFFDIIDEKTEENIYKVFLPCFEDFYQGEFYNKTLIKLFKKKIYLIDKENYKFWKYVFKKHRNELDFSQFYKYTARKAGTHKNKIGHLIVPFTKSECLEGNRRIKEMGLKKSFVCIHARGKNLKKVAYGNDTLIDESNYRSCDINTFSKACEYIYSQEVDVVRMGKFEKTPCDIDNVIDYSNKYWNELMDFYLLYKCKYILGSESGLSLIAPFWGCPALITNFTEFSCTNEALPSTGMEMYIPKKQWSIKKNRYLNLYEMFEQSNYSMGFMSNHIEKGIIFEDNTEEEILEAVKEFEAKLDGKWIESEEEQALMKRYDQIVKKWVDSHEWTYARRMMRKKEYTPVFFRPSYSYLKNNKYLLDMSL